MTDSTDLPSREETLARVIDAVYSAGVQHAAAASRIALDSLTLLDLAAEMQRRGMKVETGPWPKGLLLQVTGVIPQQEDTAE